MRRKNSGHTIAKRFEDFSFEVWDSHQRYLYLAVYWFLHHCQVSGSGTSNHMIKMRLTHLNESRKIMEAVGLLIKRVTFTTT